MSDTKRQLHKLQFDLTPDKLEDFERLRVEGGFGTRKELLNNALTVLSWVMRHARAEHTIAAIDEKSGRMYELAMPFLDAMRDPAHRR